jgi:predicted phosphoribosyltransferase
MVSIMSLAAWNATTFQDRRSAGRTLAALLSDYADRKDVVVLGLPRGGVPVALEVARALHAPLDVIVVRKLGVPGHGELAMGAIASGEVRVLNKEVLCGMGIPTEVIEAVAHREKKELEQREQMYRKGRPAQSLQGRTVILVDDGLATGSTMRAAVNAVRRQQPARIVVAVPVSSREACELFRQEVDECICALLPQHFYAVGSWYQEFEALTDSQVSDMLESVSRAATSEGKGTGGESNGAGRTGVAQGDPRLFSADR